MGTVGGLVFGVVRGSCRGLPGDKGLGAGQRAPREGNPLADSVHAGATVATARPAPTPAGFRGRRESRLPPGGPILVPMGLLAGAENEAEFAFQLSHAMAHIALRHGYTTGDAPGNLGHRQHGVKEPDRTHS